MRTIMLAVRPEWLRYILWADKTVEVRKRRLPISPCRVLLYCTKGGHPLYRRKKNGEMELMNGKVCGECICVSRSVVHPKSTPYDIEQFCDGTGLTTRQLYDYWGRSRCLFGWLMTNKVEYKKLRDVTEFGVDHAPQSYIFVEGDDEE